MTTSDTGHTLAPVDFWPDYVAFLRSRLRELGFRRFRSLPESQIEIRYFDALMRLVQPRPRCVHEARSFCIPDEAESLRPVLEQLKDKIRRGELLSPYLSKGAFDLKSSDGLLLDWRVHHLHLGEKVDPRARHVARTGPVLVARFEPDDAYLIGIKVHGEGVPEPWANEDIIEIMRAEWPQLVPELIGVSGDEVTEQQRLEARNKGVSFLYRGPDGKAYAASFGYSTARTSMEAPREADWHHRCLKHFEMLMAREFSALCKASLSQGHQLPPVVRLRLAIDADGQLGALVEGTNIRWSISQAST